MFSSRTTGYFGEELAISPTNACPLQCSHCISKSGPNADVGAPGLIPAIDEFFEVNKFSTKSVSLTGGEPFLDIASTQIISDKLFSLGIECAIVTSGFWAKTRASASEALDKLTGVSALTLSHDVYHAKFVSLRFIENAFVEAKARGLRVRVRLVQSFPPTPKELSAADRVRLFALDEDIEFQRLLRYGRANDEMLDGAGFSSPVKTFCPSTGPHISYDGRITPCCSSIISLQHEHPLVLANVLFDNPNLIWKKFVESIFLLALKIEGKPYFEKILSSLGIDTQNMEICDMCYCICANEDIWQKIKALLESEFEKRRLYLEAFAAFGFEEYKSQAIYHLETDFARSI